MSHVVERIGELLSRLQSTDFFEREEVVKELGRYREDEAVAGLVLAIEDADLGIRELAADFLTEIKGRTTSELLCRFLAHPDIGTRNLASEILVRIGSEAVPALIDQLNDEDSDVRKFAVDILGLIRDERALEPLCQKLWDDGNNVVCSAAEALGEIGSASAVPHLIAACTKIDDVRLQAVEALGKIGDGSALPHLYESLKTDDPVVLYAVIDAIGAIGKSESVAQLLPYLEQPDPTIAEACLSAIIGISLRNGGRLDCDLPLERFSGFLFDGIKRGNKEITEFTFNRLSHWYGSNVIRNLLDVIEYVDDEKFRRVADALIEIGGPAVPLIVDKLRSADKDTKVRLLELLKHCPTYNITAELLRVVEDQAPEVRQKAAHLLGISGDVSAIPALKRLARDPNGHVRAAGFAAIGWLATEKDIDFIIAGLDDRYNDVREAAVGALIIIGGPKVVGKLTADLYHPDVDRQRLAVTALGWIGETEVIESLLRASNHPDAAIRKSAISSLARIGQIGSLEPIVLALNDENSAVRKAAVTALLALEGERAINHIKLLLDDPDVWVRYHAITAIAELGVSTNADYLLRYLDDPQDIIKIATAKALATLGATKAIPALERLRKERNQDLVAAVNQAVNTLGGNQ